MAEARKRSLKSNMAENCFLNHRALGAAGIKPLASAARAKAITT
jgi:hypothetical protein